MGEFRMPSLGADMEAGTLVEWKVKAGDHVKRGDVVAVVETDKGLVDVEIWEGGVIDAIVVEPGNQVPVGAVLATTRMNGAGAAPAPRPPEAPVSPPATGAAPAPRAPQTPVSSPAPGAAPSPHVLASPAAKQLARERGIDLASLHGTGPHASITRGDVERASGGPMALREPPAAPPLVAAPAVVSPTPAAPASDGSAMRRAIAATMARSKREIPHYYVATDIDVGRARSWLDAENAKRPVTERLLFAALLLKASARAVREVPEMNGFFLEGAFQPSRGIHLGVAISLRQGGLLAPAIHDVDVKSIAEVQAALNDLVARARTGRLRSSEMSDPTMTITSLGDQGVGTVFGVIYPPQVALVGFGRVAERPWASGGMLGVRPSVTATLSADHRVSDGHRGALYLAAVDRLLQKPEDL
jgi:pyruvate dehydrogenase E2 component (dihydrolipoamide acetyltransferase)